MGGFDTREVFDDDYLYFYADRVSEERSEQETEAIWTLLDLEPGVRVLDLACGHGRLANRLAGRGATVTGLDITESFLDLARQDATEMDVDATYVLGDMRSLDWHEAFDVVVNWFTSFGYFDDDDNRRVLEGVHAALVGGGRLLLELMHRDMVAGSIGGGAAWTVKRNGDLMVDDSRFDPLSGRVLTERTVIRDSRVRSFTFFVRLFSFTEIRDWLHHTGFTEIEAFGEDHEPLKPTSRRLRVIARK